MRPSNHATVTSAARFAALLPLLLAGATSLQAQGGRRPDWWDPGLFMGGGVGTAVVPDVFVRSCDAPDGSLRTVLAVGGEALIPVGNSAIEVRGVGVIDRFGPIACPFAVRGDGTYTDRMYDTHGAGLAMLDARFRAYPLGDRKTHLSVGAGAEMLWGLPYLVVGAGWQTAGRIRTGVDVDLRAMTLEYTDLTRVWNGGAPVTLLDQEGGRELQLVGVVRLFFEIRLRDRGARPAPARTPPY